MKRKSAYKTWLRTVEEPFLREWLKIYEGNQFNAAYALGINRATLRKKLIAYGIDASKENGRG